MPIEKYRFVSPGIQVQEIDQSQIPRTPENMGPVVIGRARRGPVMRPVKVSSFSDFVDVFGEPIAGGIGGDVWRTGNYTAPTYGVYAAQAYLRNSGPLTFVRLAGYENPDAVANYGEAGWKTENAYGLFVAPIIGSNDNYSINATASLVAVIYSSASTGFGLGGLQLSGTTETTSATLGTWFRASGTNLEFKLFVNESGSASSLKTVNFDENSKKHIRSILNTNPILTNDSIVDASSQSYKGYFLGETFKTTAVELFPSLTGSDSFAGVLVKLQNHNDFRFEAKDAETGWIVSQHKGASGSFAPTGSSGEYPVVKLFKFVGLSEGEWNSQNLKISIEDIKEPPNEYVKFGSFTVSIRKMDDNDLTPQYLERFVNVSLDPSSENYVAKKIGDKYTEWDYDSKLFNEYGTYDNKSKFVRIVMNEDVNNGLTDTDLIPFGFYGPEIYDPVILSGSLNTSSIALGHFFTTAITGNSAFTASFALPEIPLLTSASLSPAASFASVFWGLKTNYANVKKHNKDMIDYVRATANNWLPVKHSFLFSLDDISASVDNGRIVTSAGASWKEGNRANAVSLTAQQNGTLVSANGSRLILSTFNKFTLPLIGGFDGVDIKEKDPFNRRILTGKSETTSYAFNSVKVAIESISDPEVVEMNLATIPGVDNEALTGLLIDKCESRGDSLAIVDLNGDYIPDEGKATPNTSLASRKPKVDDVIANLKNRAINSSYGCSFFPWVMIRDNLSNNTVWVPPSVAALGTFSSSQRRTEVWFAPAGFNRGGLTEGAAGLPVLQTALRLSSKDRDALYEANINPIATFPAEGIVIFGQKTLQVTPSALDRINVRRLMIYLKKEISRFATSILFDPNVKVTWSRFTNLAVPFLESVKSRFGLSDFRVILDETTTTPELVDRNVVYAKILLKPTRAIEFVALDFVITNTGASFND